MTQKLLLWVWAIAMPLGVIAQSRTSVITGVVKENGEVLPGVNISLKNTCWACKCPAAASNLRVERVVKGIKTSPLNNNLYCTDDSCMVS